MSISLKVYFFIAPVLVSVCLFSDWKRKEKLKDLNSFLLMNKEVNIYFLSGLALMFAGLYLSQNDLKSFTIILLAWPFAYACGVKKRSNSIREYVKDVSTDQFLREILKIKYSKIFRFMRSAFTTSVIGSLIFCCLFEETIKLYFNTQSIQQEELRKKIEFLIMMLASFSFAVVGVLFNLFDYEATFIRIKKDILKKNEVNMASNDTSKDQKVVP